MSYQDISLGLRQALACLPSLRSSIISVLIRMLVPDPSMTSTPAKPHASVEFTAVSGILHGYKYLPTQILLQDQSHLVILYECVSMFACNTPISTQNIMVLLLSFLYWCKSRVTLWNQWSYK